jgi:prepilin-type N-terminal cleavage/methylation domain-containing protein
MFFNSSVSSSAPQPLSSQSGFGLIELMVSISIMVLVSGIILSRQSSFNGAVILRSQAYEIAFALREVQQGAVSVTNDADADSFRSVLGVNFTTETLNDQNQRYQPFEDISSPAYGYDSGDNDIGNPRQIDGRFYISTLTDPDTNSYDEVSVTFERPNFDANFYDVTNGTEIDASALLIELCRVGTSCTVPEDARIIEVLSTGQIDVR